MPTTQQLAAAIAAALETAHRDDDEQTPFIRFRDQANAPEWMRDVMREAHGTDPDGSPAMLPDDHRYQFASDALDALAEHDDPDEARDSIEPDVYTSDLTGWLHSRADRVAYLDDDELRDDSADGFQRLAAAQLAERLEVFDLVRSSLDARADDDDDDA